METFRSISELFPLNVFANDETLICFHPSRLDFSFRQRDGWAEAWWCRITRRLLAHYWRIKLSCRLHNVAIFLHNFSPFSRKPFSDFSFSSIMATAEVSISNFEVLIFFVTFQLSLSSLKAFESFKSSSNEVEDFKLSLQWTIITFRNNESSFFCRFSICLLV